MKPAEFARRINTGPRNIYNIFKQRDINIGRLVEIGEVLDFDFLPLYQRGVSMVNEPGAGRHGRRDVIPFLVELDGTNETLSFWRDRLELINKAMQTTNEPVYRTRKHG